MSQDEYIRLLRQTELSNSNNSISQTMFTQNMVASPMQLSPLDALRLQRTANINESALFLSSVGTGVDVLPGYPYNPASIGTANTMTNANHPFGISSNALLQSLLRDASSHSHPVMMAQPSQPFASSRRTTQPEDDQAARTTSPQRTTTSGASGSSDDGNQQSKK